MRRRDFVKGMVAAPLTAKTLLGQQTISHPVAVPQSPAKAAPAPAAETAPTRPLRQGLLEFQSPPIASSVPDLVANTEAHFFTDVQFETLRKLSAILLPPLNGYPGAVQTGAPEFIDFLIGASPADRQNLYRSGLDRLNADAKKSFGIPFEQVSASQANTLLSPWLRTWMPDHPPRGRYEQFINVAHQDIRTATMNSQAWSVAATSSGERQPGIGLYWSPIDPDIQRLV